MCARSQESSFNNKKSFYVQIHPYFHFSILQSFPITTMKISVKFFVLLFYICRYIYRLSYSIGFHYFKFIYSQNEDLKHFYSNRMKMKPKQKDTLSVNRKNDTNEHDISVHPLPPFKYHSFYVKICVYNSVHFEFYLRKVFLPVIVFIIQAQSILLWYMHTI